MLAEFLSRFRIKSTILSELGPRSRRVAIASSDVPVDEKRRQLGRVAEAYSFVRSSETSRLFAAAVNSFKGGTSELDIQRQVHSDRFSTFAEQEAALEKFSAVLNSGVLSAINTRR